MQYLDGKTTVTHIIASNLTPKKVEEFRRYRIVKPAWIVDSVAAGKLLPWHTYSVVDGGAGQKVLDFDDGKIVSQANQKTKSYRDQSDTSWYTAQLGDGFHEPNTQLPTPGTSSPFENDVVSKGPREQDGEEDEVDDDGVALQQTLADEMSSSLQDQLVEDLQEEDEADGGVPLELVPDQQNLQAPMPDIRRAQGLDTFGRIEDQRAQEDIDNDRPTSEQGDGADSNVGQETNAENDIEQVTSAQRQAQADFTDAFHDKKRKLESEGLSPSKKAKLTAEEHNAILLSDPRIRNSSVLNPEFLDQYYRESRLHHLSTWKADLKAQLQAATAEQTSTQKAKQKRSPGARRYILHVDFDSFFVAVSLKNHPEYVDKPACVAHGPGPNSEIASCNYPARKFGIKNGMWMKKAHDICDDLKVLPYDFPAYEAASRMFYEAIMATGGIVQSVSVDEALVDITAFCLPAGGTDGTNVREGSIWREQEKANDIAQGLRDQVKEQTGCAVSVGVGGNILLAKVALRKAKPAGQYHIKPEEVLNFIGALEVQDLPGVAYSLGGKLEEIGVKFVKDIRDLTKEKLVNTLGPKTGEKLWNYSRGIDRAEVGDQVIRKSVSAEVNWGVRFETQDQAEEFVDSLCGELNRRLVKERVKGKQVTMKVMRRSPDAPLDPPKHLGHGKCDTHNKSILLGVATNQKDVLVREVMSVFRGFGFSPGELRGLGVQMTKLEPIKQKIGDALSSQRRLQFKSGSTEKKPGSEHPAEELPKLAEAAEAAAPMPDKQPSIPPKPPSSQRPLQFKVKEQQQQNRPPIEDPIQDDPETPKKQKPPGMLPQQADALQGIDSPNRKRLNTLGTQFVMPTQVDPQVLAELPPDIRSKLAAQLRTPAAHQQANDPTSTDPKNIPFTGTILPSHSQLDPAILDALPADVRAEIQAHYATSPSNRHKGAQSRLPQSPHKNHTLPSRAGPAPARRGRGRPRGSTNNLLTRLKAARTTTSNNNGLAQSNFVANRAQTHDHATDSEGGNDTDKDISSEFLEALPEDIRAEVLAQHRAAQLKRTAGIEISAKQRKKAPARRRGSVDQAGLQYAHNISADGGRERVLVLDARPARPTFTMQKLSEIGELREAISNWYAEFREEGPYGEDVEALGGYLGRVVGGEGDMGKAIGVCRWLSWVVEGDVADGDEGGDKGGDKDGGEEGGRQKWREALETARRFVREAVGERGLGGVDI